MGNGVSGDQGNLPSYGTRDVKIASDRKQHDWSELAKAPNANSLLSVAHSYKLAALVAAGKLFQARAAAAGNARSPMVERRVDGTCSVIVSVERRRRRRGMSAVS